jgi:hypothetical protein
MPDRRFPICSVPVPACIGREALLAKVMGSLIKSVPDHLQIIGARFAGKTVLLAELIQRLRAGGGPYTAVIHLDLGHRTPADDSEFLQRLKQELVDALKPKHPDYAAYLEGAGGSAYADIAAVLDALAMEGKVLAILDGFDRALVNGRLSRDLWDNMRELAAKPSLRLVAASRRRLRELIRHPESQGSPFWNIFELSPISVACFDEHDLDAVLQRTPEIHLSAGARTELWNYTNGYPVLVLEALNAAISAGQRGEVSVDVMRDACDEAYGAARDRLDALWEDCSSTSRDLFRLVNEESSLLRTQAAGTDAECLSERGFVHVSGNKLQRPNRLLARFVGELPNEATAMARLFAAKDRYEVNLRGVFERRLAQLDGLDATLRKYLVDGAEDLPHHPDVFLTHVRGFVDRVFELIWQAEIPDKCIPSAWLHGWQHKGEKGINDWGSTSATFPQRAQRVRLLGVMVGTQSSARTAQKVSRGTYALMNGAYTFGEIGQHQEGMRIDVGTGYAALHLCIELAASLQRDLLAAP